MTSSEPQKNILHIISGLSTGGAEMMLLKLLSNADRQCSKHEVISMIDIGTVGKKIQELGIPVHGIGLRMERPNPLSFWRLIKKVREFKPSLIQGWMYHGNLAAQFAHTFLPRPVPVVWNIRHSLYDLAYEKKTTAWMIRLGAKLSNRPAKIIYNSKVSAGQHEALGYAADKTTLIPNGFDTDIFFPSEEARVEIRQELGLSPSTFLIGLIGRYHPMKDHGNFIRAADLISKSNPEIHFILVGRNVQTDNNELMDMFKNTKVLDKFHLLGERSDLNRLTPSLDIATSSSYFGEGFPNVMGEAMACGVPCVVTDVGDGGWVVGDTGLVVPAKDPQAMASAWKKLLDMGPGGRKDLGAKARKRITSDFSLQNIVSQYESLYSGILNSH